ncbi:hypothetical protein, partial [Fulvivirga aurantia]|uniref:hypothetical protein n=1 Tax=Fulvivirga aurantia TaxID=2529383 RepID=UPI00162A51E7
PTGLSDGDDVNDADASPTNEIQDLSSVVNGTDRTINISGGSGTVISVADNDNSPSNEIQLLSKSGNSINLSNGGGSVLISELAAFRSGVGKDHALTGGVSLIIFENVDYDLNNDFDGASSFIAPFEGIYNFSGTLTLNVDSGADSEFYVLVDNVPEHLILMTSSENIASFSFSVDLLLFPNERVQLGINSTKAGDIIGDPIQSNWSGRLIMETTK